MEDDQIISDDFAEGDMSTASTALISAVANWKLDARSEDNDRYFFHVRELNSIENGERCYVIGRKGSGKTAISEYLGNNNESNRFSEKLTFKSFPFNELYALEHSSFTRPNQYITLWKYIIYTSICKLMLRNEAIDITVRERLKKIYDADPKTLSRKISRWVAKDFSISILGFSLTINGTNNDKDEKISWIEKVNALEDLIEQNIDSSKYYVIFDELDEDYRNIIEESKYEQYTALITSLFKAVQNIKSVFRNKKYNILPVIFLRDDIYEIVQDADKNKWNDFKIELNWDKDKIKKLVAFRLTRALDGTASQSLDFEAAWQMLFGKEHLGVGRYRERNKISSFDFIARSTYFRPRDFIKYLQACSQDAVEADGLVTGKIVRKVDKAFSNYLKDELTDELFAILPDISEIFDSISQIRKWNFTISDFERIYSTKLKQKKFDQSAQSTTFVLQILFLFSVIGNAPGANFYVFRYLNREARLNFNERIVVHRGLFKALQII